LKILCEAFLALAAASLVGQVGLQAQDADAGTSHYVITNNDLYRTPSAATVFKFTGSALEDFPALDTGGWGLGGGYFGTNKQAVATVGTTVCVFVADPGSDDIGAFNTTNFSHPTKVGNYSDPAGSGAYIGIALAAHGTTLYAAYTASLNIAVWTVNSDCSLTLAKSDKNTPTYNPVDDIAVSPDGKTLVATYGQRDRLGELNVDSYAISGTTLTEKGPFTSIGGNGTAGVDITRDSKYAIVADFSDNRPTQVEIFPINSDSSLGSSDYYEFSQGGLNSNNIWLSPDGTLLYVSNQGSFQITTLKFNENAGRGSRLSFDCLTTLNNPEGQLFFPIGMATEGRSGTGGYMYVAEGGNPPAVALLQVPTSGCPTEVAGSPFSNSVPGAWTTTVSAYPPRPF
jgi:6-phosphogluconolactonase (cycloisomerase 2 family)